MFIDLMAILVCYTTFAILLHAVVCHNIKYGSAFSKFLLVGSIIGGALLKHCYKVFGFGEELISLALTYAFMCELYMFMFTFISSSISVSILFRVLNGEVNVEKLSTDYSGEIMVTNRLRRLQDVGFLIENSDVLQLTNRGRNLVKLFSNLQWIFGFKEK